jgi:hypothetical protein
MTIRAPSRDIFVWLGRSLLPHDERRSRTPDTANRRERSYADLCGSIEARDVTVMPMLRVPSWTPSAATQGARAPLQGTETFRPWH